MHFRSEHPGSMQFHFRIRTLVREFLELWTGLDSTGVPFTGPVSPVLRHENESRITEFIRKSRENRTARASGMLEYRKKTGEIIREIAQSTSPCHRERTEVMLHQFAEAGDRFIHDARAFDPAIRSEDIHQALRNLWIINSLQAAYEMPVSVESPGFAYSLLYPYTDNYLDDGNVSPDRKRTFISALGNRLDGKKDRIPGPAGKSVERLVRLIEEAYPRSAFRNLFESLLGIHRAQEKSLLQHGCQDALPDSALLDVSIEKGGTSVLADAYLVRGDLDASGIRFSFGYGMFLQLIDDIQDVAEDLRAGHRTVCTLAANDGTLEHTVNRLVRFIREVLALDVAPRRKLPEFLAELVDRSCCGLILETIAANPGLFSPRYAAMVEQYSPVGFSSLRNLRAESERLKAMRE